MKLSDIKTKKDGNFIHLQIKNNTVHGLFKIKSYYKSDSFSNTYDTITDAKKHTLELAQNGYFGEYFKL